MNLTADYYRLRFLKATPSAEHSFTDYVSNLKTLFNIWLKLSQVSNYQDLHYPIIMNKLLDSCNPLLVSILLETEPKSLDEVTRINDQYFSAYPSVKVQKDITVPFNAFACASFNMLDEELDAGYGLKIPTHILTY